MKTYVWLRAVAIVFAVVALVLIGIAATAQPSGSSLALTLAGGSAVVTIGAMLLSARKPRPNTDR